MKFKNLEQLVKGKDAVLLCHLADNPSEQVVIPIVHMVEPGLDKTALKALSAKFPDLPELIELYTQYGELTLFQDIDSDEAVYSIASPEYWDELQSEFERWIEDIEDKERKEYFPAWIDYCQVIGERPGSARYFLIPKQGDSIGQVYEFDHDGLTFHLQSESIIDFIESISNVENKEGMKNIASELRNINFDSKGERWSVSEYKDSNRTVSLNEDAGCYTLEIICIQYEFTPNEKYTRLAKLTLIQHEENRLHSLKHTEVELPNDRKIVVVSEVTQYGSHITIRERADDSLIGGNSLLSAYATTEMKLKFRLDDETFLMFELEPQT